jgi:hypothetical protein
VNEVSSTPQFLWLLCKHVHICSGLILNITNLIIFGALSKIFKYQKLYYTEFKKHQAKIRKNRLKGIILFRNLEYTRFSYCFFLISQCIISKAQRGATLSTLGVYKRY